MPYTYRYLTAEQRDAIGKRATTPHGAQPVDEGLQAAWEADLAAHQALLAAAADDDSRARHADAVKTLELALTKAARGR